MEKFKSADLLLLTPNNKCRRYPGGPATYRPGFQTFEFLMSRCILYDMAGAQRSYDENPAAADGKARRDNRSRVDQKDVE